MYKYTLEVKFETNKHASVVHGTVSVDEELMKETVKREIFLKENVIAVLFHSESLRNLRSSVKGMIEGMHLSLQTIKRFEKFS